MWGEKWIQMDKIERITDEKKIHRTARNMILARQKQLDLLPEVLSYILFLDYAFPSIPKLSISLY